MSDYFGSPGEIESVPTPAAAVNISSSTFATPIVVTTAAAHGLKTGQAVLIYGHLVNTNANGVRLALVLSSTTFSLQTLAGANVSGNGIGAGTGTSQSLGMPGISLPEDAVTDIDASSVNVGFEALADMVAYLFYRMLTKQRLLSGGTADFATGTDLTIASNTDISGPAQLTATSLLVDTGSQILFGPNGRLAMSAPQRPTDADHTISCASGQIVILPTPTAVRTLTIAQASDTDKQDGDWIQFYMAVGGTPGMNYWRIKREGSANYIVQFDGLDSGGLANGSLVRIHLEGGVWRRTGGTGFIDGTDA